MWALEVEHIVLELRAPTIQGIGHITSSFPSAKGRQVRVKTKLKTQFNLTFRHLCLWEWMRNTCSLAADERTDSVLLNESLT